MAYGLLAPESPWADLSCARLAEFLLLNGSTSTGSLTAACSPRGSLKESVMLVAESTDEIVDSLLSIRLPGQRVMTTIAGRGGGLSQPQTRAMPPDFRPHPYLAGDVEVTRAAYRQMA